jgi:hypothetical protein
MEKYISIPNAFFNSRISSFAVKFEKIRVIENIAYKIVQTSL